MERRDPPDADNMEIVAVENATPIAEAPAAEVADAVPGYAVAVETESPPTRPAGSFDAEASALPHRNGELHSVLECMLFVAQEPLSAPRLAEMLGMDEGDILRSLGALEAQLEAGGLQLMRLAGGFQICTRPEFADYCAMVLEPARKKLSRAALETLAVVAYRQPCTVPEIEAVRGVSVGGVIKTLLDRGLVKEAGRKPTPGRPVLYTTTPDFLDYFGLNDISELPDIDVLAVEEIRALEAQRELLLEEQADTEEATDQPQEPDAAPEE